MEDSSNVNELTELVTAYIKFNIDMLIPVKTIKQYGNNTPWLSSDLRKQIVDKHKAFASNAPDYAEKQANLNKALNEAKQHYKIKVENLFKQNNTRDAWKGLRILTGQEERRQDNMLTNTPGSADRLNHFYARFDCHDFSQDHQLVRDNLLQLAQNDAPPITTELEVYQELKKVCVKKATGPDGISAYCVKNCALSLSCILHKIFQLSAQSATFPSSWKCGEIIPVSKKSIPLVDNDLSPITLTSIISKVYERVMLPKLLSHVKPCLDPLQFAYLQNRSTEDAISTVLHEISQHLDRPSSYARCLFIDFSSAFNTIQPHILLGKLSQYNVPATLQLWVLDFLTNRSQRVRTCLETSEYITINTGAPQGCVLSAFLFIIYTNEMVSNSNDCKIVKYADDTAIIGKISSCDETAYRETIENALDWCNTCFLNLNVAKTKEMAFDFRKNKPALLPITINGEDVEAVEKFTYLGVTFQNDLKWDLHLLSQTKKVNKRFYYVYCLNKLNIDKTIICLFYNSVISSVLTYAITCWFSSSTERCRQDLVKLRKRLCRMVGPQFCNLLDDPSSVFNSRCINAVRRICNDDRHPLHACYNLLPSGRRYAQISCRTSRFKNSFIPSSIRLVNDNSIIF